MEIIPIYKDETELREVNFGNCVMFTRITHEITPPPMFVTLLLRCCRSRFRWRIDIKELRGERGGGRSERHQPYLGPSFDPRPKDIREKEPPAACFFAHKQQF